MKNFFKGRINRMQYFLLSLILVAIFFVVIFFIFLLHNFRFSGLLIVLWVFISFISHLSIAARRFHDIGISGYYCLFFLVPGANLVFPLVLLFQRGDKDENRFGPAVYKSSLYDTLLNK